MAAVTETCAHMYARPETHTFNHAFDATVRGGGGQVPDKAR